MTVFVPHWLIAVAHAAGIFLLALLVFLGIVMAYMIVSWHWK